MVSMCIPMGTRIELKLYEASNFVLQACSQSGSRILVPYWMISQELTHQAGPLCQTQQQSKVCSL